MGGQAGFCEGGRKRAVRLQEPGCPLKELPLYCKIEFDITEN